MFIGVLMGKVFGRQRVHRDAATVPRTALRYAIEHLDEELRARYVNMKKATEVGQNQGGDPSLTTSNIKSSKPSTNWSSLEPSGACKSLSTAMVSWWSTPSLASPIQPPGVRCLPGRNSVRRR
jgi:hypothetical protein